MRAAAEAGWADCAHTKLYAELLRPRCAPACVCVRALRRFDKAICIYEFDKLDKPREAFQRMVCACAPAWPHCLAALGHAHHAPPRLSSGRCREQHTCHGGACAAVDRHSSHTQMRVLPPSSTHGEHAIMTHTLRRHLVPRAQRKCHTAAIVSMAYDHTANCILSGSIDGSMKVWSMEGR